MSEIGYHVEWHEERLSPEFDDEGIEQARREIGAEAISNTYETYEGEI